jgi:hypothetical protein
MPEAASDYRTLIKSKHYVDLPGEPPKSKLWTDVNNLIILRKHRDVVFDIKLGNGATYTVTTEHPQSEYGRFYDPKQKAIVTKIAVKDGEPCHIWLGRTFEGSLILKHGDKVLGSYPIRRMDCTQGCTEDPKDKPAPVLITIHNDPTLAEDLKVFQNTSIASGGPSASLKGAFDRARSQTGLQPAPFEDRPQPAAAALADTHGLTVSQAGQQQVLQMVHLFEVKPRPGLDVPADIEAFFVSGDRKWEIDPNKDLCRNWVIAQSAGVLGYFHDALSGEEGWLRKFWRRKIFLVRNEGKYVMMFTTGPEDWRIVGVLLAGYKKVANSQIVTIAGGAGKLGASARAAWSAAHDSVLHGAGVALAFSMAIDCMVWFDAYKKHEKDFWDLVATLGIDVLKAGIVAGAASGTISALLTVVAFFAGTVSVSILVIAVGTAAIAVVAGYAVDVAFDKSGLGSAITKAVKSSGSVLEKSSILEYENIYSASEWLITPSGH